MNAEYVRRRFAVINGSKHSEAPSPHRLDVDRAPLDADCRSEVKRGE